MGADKSCTCSLRPAVVLTLVTAAAAVAVEAVATFAGGFTWFSPLGLAFALASAFAAAFLGVLACASNPINCQDEHSEMTETLKCLQAQQTKSVMTTRP